MKSTRVLFYAAVFFLSSFFAPASSLSLSCEDCLKGLEGLELLVEEVKGELEDYNLTAIQLQTDIEAKLREAEIKILSKEENESLQPLRKPYLYVRINSRKMPWKRAIVAYHIEISLKQFVSVSGKPKSAKKTFYAPTWHKEYVGAAAPKDFAEIRDEVNRLTEKFIKAYLSANPKP